MCKNFVARCEGKVIFKLKSNSSISLHKLLLLLTTGQISRGGKDVPDHMDKIVWAAAPRIGLVGVNHFPPHPGLVADHLDSCMVSCSKISRTRTCDDDDHVDSDLWGFGSESEDCADPAPNQIIGCLLVGRILDRFFRVT
jgi:hypothetical protein